MKKLKSYLFVIVVSIVLITLSSSRALAHDPPYCGKTDCGLIVGDTFYSTYYSPGDPNGTPKTSGSGTWVQTSSTSCGTQSYGGTTYTKYPHIFSCNVPLDSSSYILMLGAGILGFFQLRKRIHFSFSH